MQTAPPIRDVHHSITSDARRSLSWCDRAFSSVLAVCSTHSTRGVSVPERVEFARGALLPSHLSSSCSRLFAQGGGRAGLPLEGPLGGRGRGGVGQPVGGGAVAAGRGRGGRGSHAEQLPRAVAGGDRSAAYWHRVVGRPGGPAGGGRVEGNAPPRGAPFPIPSPAPPLLHTRPFIFFLASPRLASIPSPSFSLSGALSAQRLGQSPAIGRATPAAEPPPHVRSISAGRRALERLGGVAVASDRHRLRGRVEGRLRHR